MTRFTRALCLLLIVFGSAAADTKYSSASLYQLQAKLTNQSGREHGLDVYAGYPTLVTLFYGSCTHTCPLLIESVRAVERSYSDQKNLRILLISIDPQRDTPAALSRLAQERRIDLSRWTLASTGENSVRHIAAALNIQYKEAADGEFNHSSVITVLSRTGEIAHQSSAMGKVDGELLAKLRSL